MAILKNILNSEAQGHHHEGLCSELNHRRIAEPQRRFSSSLAGFLHQGQVIIEKMWGFET